MALVFIEGFEFASNSTGGMSGTAEQKWDYGWTVEPQAGRWDGAAWAISTVLGWDPATWWQSLTKTFNNPSSYYVFGAAMTFGDLNGIIHPAVWFAMDYLPIVSLWADPVTGHWQLRKGAGQDDPPIILLNTPFVPPIGLWFYCEFKVDLITNSVELRINGVSLGTASGLSLPGTGTMNQLHIGGMGRGSASPAYDDLYVIDNNGTVNTDFLGEIHVRTNFPALPGTHQDFIPASGTDHIAMFAGGVRWTETGYHNSGVSNGATDTYIMSPWATGTNQVNLIPTMTSNTTPSGVASASTAYVTTPAYSAFGIAYFTGGGVDATTNGWVSDGSALPQWLQYQFTAAQTISQYSITPSAEDTAPWSNNHFPSRSPSTWQLQGSNDGSSWTTLDTHTGYASWVYGTPVKFSLTPATYRYFRLYVTANGGDTHVGVANLSFQDLDLAQGHIFGVNLNLSVRKDDVGNRLVQSVLRTPTADTHGNQEWYGADYGLFGQYTFYEGGMFDNNPSTGLPWELVDLNITEFGLRIPPGGAVTNETLAVGISETSAVVIH